MRIRASKNGAIAEINVTPMADVMIVLLIIFMVAIAISGSPLVQLPNAANAEKTSETPLIVVVKADRTVKIGATALPYPAPVEAIARAWFEACAPGRHEALLQADESVPYTLVAEVMEALRRAGVERIGLQTRRFS